MNDEEKMYAGELYNANYNEKLLKLRKMLKNYAESLIIVK